MAVNFFTGYDNPDFNDTEGGNIDSAIQQLMSGNLGKQMAARSTGRIRQQALDNLSAFRNSPGAGRNAAVSAAFSDRTQQSAGKGIIDAQLQGAEFDTRNLEAGANLAQNQQQFKYRQFENKLERSDRQSPFASLLTSAVSSAAGVFTGYGAAAGAKAVFGDLQPKPKRRPRSFDDFNFDDYGQQSDDVPTDDQNYG